MKLGYPCINNKLGLTTSKTLRLASYSEDKIKEVVAQNLSNLKNILEFNTKNNLLFFRIGSKLIPFASHPINTFNWKEYFKKEFEDIGKYIKENRIRISMHPDQFTLINSPTREIVERSFREILYHVEVLDLFNLDKSHKIQIHIGGVYGDKEKSIKRFIYNYKKLSKKIKERLVIENDERMYSVQDCLRVSKEVDIPIVFDSLHHEINNNGESFKESLLEVSKTWKEEDGIPMMDYSNQDPEKRIGAHIYDIDIEKFKSFLKETKEIDKDIMFEIKNKEESAIKAKEVN
jgi:UV DNA damage endonuclease